jgi:transcriptional regulator with XRE-family HTH domain
MKDTEVLIKFGKRVRFLRNEKNLSQEELSFKADLHRTYIGMIERAEKNITLINIEKIAKAFEISIDNLLNFDNGE